MDSQTDPGAGLAKQLTALHQAAGRPTLDRVVNAVHQLRGQKSLSDSTLSGWLRGRSVPSDTALFRAVVKHLLASAPDFPHQSLMAWEHLRAAAEAQKNKQRGRRPRPEAPAKLLLFALPRPPAQPFTGRKTELVALERAGRQPGPQVTVIHGLSGTGKTELAVQYAARNRERHPVIWWTAAGTTEAIAAGLARMGRRLPGKSSGVAEAELTESAIRWLQEHDQWLLLLDDVSSRAAVEGVLGGLGSGHILITSRRDLPWGGMAHNAVHLQPLDSEASHDLLTARCSAADADRLNELANDMGHLPLALCQAAAFIKQSRTSVGTYLARLRSQPVRALTTTAYGDPSEQAVGRVLAITVEAVEQQNPFAIAILGVLACYAPHDIPRELLRHPDDFLIDDALAALVSFNLITLTADTVSVHRLVQIFANEHLREKNRTSDSADAADQVPRPLDNALELAYMLLSEYRPTGHPQADVDDWPRWSALAPHVDALLAHVPVEEAGDGLGALAGEMALFHHGQGNPGRALELSRHSLQITELNFGPDAVEVAIQLDNIAGALRDLGRYAEVEDLQRRAVEICKADPDRSHLAIRLDNLAHTLQLKGRLEEAEQIHRRALSIVEETLGADDPEYAASLNSLAMTLTAQGRPDEAEPLLRQALVINDEHFGSTNPRVADNLDNLGIALRRLRRAEEAEPAHRRALHVTEQLLGEDHPAVAVRLANLASAVRELGGLDEALSMQQRALDIHLESDGPEHPEVAVSLVNLAAILTDAGAYPEAERHLRRALEIHLKILDANHPQISATKTNLALCLVDVDRFTEAEELLYEALHANVAHFGDEHLRVARSCVNLAQFMSRIDRPDRARPHQARAAAIVDGIFGPDHPATIAALDDLTKILIDLDLPHEAEPLLRRSLKTAEEGLGVGHPDLAMRMHALAEALQDQGHLEEARDLIRKALSISETSHGSAHPDVVIGLNNLAVVTGRIDGHAAAAQILREACDAARALEDNFEMYETLCQNLDDCLALVGDQPEPPT